MGIAIKPFPSPFVLRKRHRPGEGYVSMIETGLFIRK